MADEAARNVALVRRWFDEVWNQKQSATIHELMSDDCLAHGTSEAGDDMRGAKAFEGFHARLIQAFPDIHVQVEDCFGVGDRVAVRWFATMHHRGDGLGMPATQAEVSFAGMGISRWIDGKAVETWDNYDKLAMFQQIEAARAKAASA